MRDLVAKAGLDAHIRVSSAGTGAWHVGEPADPRSAATAQRRGVKLTSRARHFDQTSFAEADYVVAMDGSNLRNLHALARSDADRAKIHLMRDFDADSPKGSAVPDPYAGGPEGFENVFDLVHAAASGFLEHLRHAHDLK